MLSSQEKLLVLVGKNGSGKTYTLDKILRNEENAIMITGDGVPVNNRFKNEVKIDNKFDKYIYADEQERGSDKSTTVELISPDIKPVLKYAEEIQNRIGKFPRLSKGQEKLNNIVTTILSYNLNNIQFILLDEPDTYLDEEYMKVLKKIINMLVKANVKIRLSTHNPRMIKILDIDISYVFLIYNKRYIRLSFEDIRMNYKRICEDIQTIRKENKLNMTSGIDFKLGLSENEDLLKCFIYQNITDEEFYKALFCSNIFIIEGESDRVALSYIKDEFDTSVSLFSAGGKAFIPFFAWIFNHFKKDVTVIIDEDEETNKNAYEITLYLEKLNETDNIKLIKHIPDLEKHYGLDSELIAQRINMSGKVKQKNKGWLKYISSYIFFKEEDNSDKLKNHVLGENAQEFEFN
ncbi:TOPRIM nucleotidyl transferase/hydrolase domain-containing protein [Paraclostridium sordellii]|uniref:TOPRIM nucleotidyl transferase/hydrolase domain-containing protein n=1 Tax=Paraclostridium sordellii TaxID=1505 RepID=UPI0005E51791|nr:TOPRIM nucleotidyl transferase/hydrolase domain-containing protein [Paeniclostridium sordellii]CEN90083.1 cytochrome c biogenesis protein CcmA [[Clostridium] sordellii] [Paeniclostridium sordellii]